MSEGTGSNRARGNKNPLQRTGANCASEGTVAFATILRVVVWQTLAASTSSALEKRSPGNRQGRLQLCSLNGSGARDLFGTWPKPEFVPVEPILLRPLCCPPMI